MNSNHRRMGLIPPLNGLRLFEAAARCGSFKLAAQELDLTPGAVSHGINALEKWLDVALFDRKRGLVLTPAGKDESFSRTDDFSCAKKSITRDGICRDGIRSPVTSDNKTNVLFT